MHWDSVEFLWPYCRLSITEMCKAISDEFPGQAVSIEEDIDKGPAGTYHVSLTVENPETATESLILIWPVNFHYIDEDAAKGRDRRQIQSDPEWKEKLYEHIARALGVSLGDVVHYGTT